MTSLPHSQPDMREAIAKIISPGAWADDDNLTPTERAINERLQPERREISLAKADAILAIRLAPAEGREALPRANAEQAKGGWRLDFEWLAQMQTEVEKATGYGVTLECVEEIALRVAALRAVPNAGEVVAWTNESQLGFLKDPACAEIPMAMWAKESATSPVALYASPPAARVDVRDRVVAHEDCLNCRCTDENRCAGTEPRFISHPPAPDEVVKALADQIEKQATPFNRDDKEDVMPVRLTPDDWDRVVVALRSPVAASANDPTTDIRNQDWD